MTTPLRGLLGGIVDYAGLFPPASLAMADAVAAYSAYRDGPDAWMLGAFVAPASRLDDLRDALREQGIAGPWPVSVTCDGASVVEDVRRALGGQWILAGIEARLGTEEAIRFAAQAVADHAPLFVELPPGSVPGPLLAVVQEVGAAAKIRTGGVTPEAFPPAAQVVAFIRACIEAPVRFKATAGLHHPLTGEYRLTYAADAPRHVMYGYLNVFLAAAGIAGGMPDDEAIALLNERDRTAVIITDGGIRWRDRSWNAAQLASARTMATSFGSCSFREPVDELAPLAAP